jgi:hypothetical protein
MAMDPTTAMYIWIAVFFIGIVVFFMGVFRKYSPIKMNPVLGAVVGICLILPGFIWGIFPAFPAQPLQQTSSPTVIVQQPSGTTSLTPATFDVDAVAVTAATGMWGAADITPITTTTFDAAETTLTIPVTCNTGTGNYAFAVNHTGANFTIRPIAPSGVDADDLATIYFESEYDMTFDGEDVLNSNAAGSIYDAEWNYLTFNDASHQEWDHSGSFTMLYTDSVTLSLYYQLDGENGKLADEFATVGDTTTWTITFHNSDWSWSKSYGVVMICIASA